MKSAFVPWLILFSLFLAPVQAAAEANYVFYTAETVRWGTSTHQLLFPRVFPGADDLTAGQLASEAFHRLSSFRGGDYADASLKLDNDFSSTGGAQVICGKAAKASLHIVTSEIYWTLRAAGVREIRMPEIQKTALGEGDVALGVARIVVQLWQILPPGKPGTGLVLLGGKLDSAENIRRRLDSRDKSVINAVLALLKSPYGHVRLSVVKSVLAAKFSNTEAALIPLLRDSETGVRKAVIASFKGSRSKSVLKALEEVVKSDRDPSIKASAVRILIAAGIKKYALFVRLEKLKNPNDSVVMDAIEKLVKSGNPAVAMALIDVLSNGNRQVADMALSGIIKLNNVTALRKAVESTDVPARYRAATARTLAGRSGDDADLGLGHLIAHGAPKDRVWAIGEVAKRRRYKLVKLVIGSLGHGESNVRKAAAKALGTIKDSKALVPLSQAATKAPSDRKAFEAAIVTIFSGLSVDQVIKFSSHNDQTLRKLSIKSLAKFSTGGRPPQRVLNVLMKRLTDTDREIRRSAAFALARIRDSAVVAALIKLANDPDGPIREQVAISVTHSKHPQANTILLKYLEDNFDATKRAAVSGLRIRKVASALPKLRYLADYRETTVRRAVLRAIVELAGVAGWAKFFEVYSNALFDQDIEVKIWAVRGISVKRDPRIPGLLSNLVTCPDIAVQLEALKALGNSGQRDAVGAISPGLFDTKKKVRMASINALGKLNLEQGKKPLREFITAEAKKPTTERDKELLARANDVYDNLP